jgi:HemY protein
MVWLILRVLMFVGVVALVAAAAGLLVDTRGFVSINLAGADYPPLTLVEFAALVALTMVALLVLYRIAGLLVALLRFLLGDETSLSRFWSRAKERRGLEALSKGMVALAEGDLEAAAVSARRATRLLGSMPLTELLNAQLAEAKGDPSLAKRHYRVLAKEPSTAMLGVKGLLSQAVKAGESGRAMRLAEHAASLRPKDAAVQQTLFDLQVRQSNWEGALRTLRTLVAGKALPKDVAARREAVLDLEIARAAKAAGDDKRAREAAEDAVRSAPGLGPAAVFAAQQHLAAGDASRAARVLKEAWRQAPQPEIAAAFAAIAPDEKPAQRRKRFRDLIGRNDEHDESRLLLAELAIADNDWREARRALGDLPERKPTHRALAMMAAIEKGEGSPEHVVRGYLARAVTAPRGAHWVCEACAAAPGAWSAVCPSCGAFDTLAWRETGGQGEALGAAMLPLVVGAPEARSEDDALDEEAAAEAVREAQPAR